MASILIVDDNRGLRRALGESLRHAGHHVRLAENGVDALAQYNSEPFDLVITDIYMPEMDGIELLIRIQHESPGVRVLVMSGGGYIARHKMLDDARHLGAVETIAKPFQPEEFLDAVERALDPPEPTPLLAQTCGSNSQVPDDASGES